MARFCRDGAANDQVVTVEDTRPGHAVTADQYDVGMRCFDAQQLVQGHLVIHVIQRRAGKAGRNVRVKERDTCAAGVECAND